MADQIKFAAPDANGMRWAKGTSKKGVSFQWGFKDTGNLTASKPAIKAAKASSDDDGVNVNGVAVNWPVEGVTWIPTSSDVQHECHVDRYYLQKLINKVSFSYELGFHNTGGWVRYFKDEDGDEYRCTTTFNIDHTVRYNSDKPTIVHVR